MILFRIMNKCAHAYTRNIVKFSISVGFTSLFIMSRRGHKKANAEASLTDNIERNLPPTMLKDFSNVLESVY